jgi:hypothetical protein
MRLKSISKHLLAPLIFLATSAHAQNIGQQSPPSGSINTLVNVNGISQFNTNLSSGGSFSWQDANVSLTSRYQIDANSSIGINLREGYQHWTWTNSGGSTTKALWTGIQSPGVGLSYFQKFNDGWSAGITPMIDWIGENGVGTAGSATYGAIGSASKEFSKDLTLGLGAGVFRQIDQTKIFPYLVINWNINDKWRLSNPLPAGPAGGAGLELSYALSDQWQLGGGAAYRSYRFRLNNSNGTPNGIGQNSFAPVFARLTYFVNKSSRADLYLGANAGGKLSVTDSSGNTSYSSNYQTGLAAALSFSTRF